MSLITLLKKFQIDVTYLLGVADDAIEEVILIDVDLVPVVRAGGGGGARVGGEVIGTP